MKVYLSVVIAMVCWSLTFVWFKIANEVYAPFTIIFLRLIISSLILMLVAWFTKALQKIRRKDLKWILIMSLFNPFFYFIGESLGLTMVSSTLAAVIISTIPLFVPVGAFFFLGERLSTLNISGIIISFIGVLVIILNSDLSFGPEPAGILLLALAVFCAVGYTLMVGKLITRYNAYSLTTYQNLAGIVLFLPLVLIFEYNPFLEAQHAARSVIALLCLAFFGSTVAFILYNYGVKHLGASKTNIFTNIIPVLTAIFAYLILNETITFKKLTGIAIVLTGLFISQLKRNYRKSRFVSP